jgi:hypothetical protein
MRPTAACFAPGFFQRSLDEFKRLSNFGERPISPMLPCVANAYSAEV